MERFATPEGTLSLAVVALLLVLGQRFLRPDGALRWLAFLSYAAALVAGWAAQLGFLEGAADAPGAPLRLAGAALLVGGLLLAARAARAARVGPAPKSAGAPALASRPGAVELGLVLVLAGQLLRLPSRPAAVITLIAAALLALGALLRNSGRGEAPSR